MDADKQVGLILVGDLGPAVQFYKIILIPGVDHMNILHVMPDQVPKFKRNSQVDVFLLCLKATGTWVMTSVAGVDDNCLYRITTLCR